MSRHAIVLPLYLLAFVSLLACEADLETGPGDAGRLPVDGGGRLDGSVTEDGGRRDGGIIEDGGASSGRCGSEVRVVADGSAFAQAPAWIAERGDYLYVGDSSAWRGDRPERGNLVMVPKDGGPATVVDTEGVAVEHVAIFGDNLYWLTRPPALDGVLLNPYTIRTSPITPLAPRTLVTITPADLGFERLATHHPGVDPVWPRYFEVNADGIFFKAQGTVPDGSDAPRSFTLRIDLSGSYGAFEDVSAGPVDDTHLYSVEYDELVRREGSLVRTPTAGGASDSLCRCVGLFPRVSDTHVYYVSDAAIWRVAKTGGDPERLGVAPGDIRDLLLTDAHVYFITPTAIGRVPVGGGLSSLIVGLESDNPVSLITDGECLFWADATNGSGVYSLAIPPE